MKKVSYFAAIIAAAVITSGITAYSVSRSVKSNPAALTERSNFGTVASPTHFTTYEAQQYPDLTYAAENAVKAVVAIEVTQEIQGGYSRGYDSFFEQFFGIPQDQSRSQQPRTRTGGGSGVIISSDGYIVTNHHVVDKASKLKVIFEDGTAYDATLIGTDPSTEVALIKIEAEGLPTIPFGNSDELRLGQWVLAIGSPYSLQNTVTAGIISAKGRSLDAISRENNPIEMFIQTDAAVNPGNSGGALVNAAGELVGINTLITSPTGSYIGYSFAVPSSIVMKVAGDLREHGVVQRAMLGVYSRPIDQAFIDEMGKETGITEKGGVYVAQLEEGGAAEAAGIKEGDVIIEFNGVKINDPSTLSYEVGRKKPNDKAEIVVKRGKEVKHFDVTLRNKLGNTDVVGKDATAMDMLGGEFANVSEKLMKDLSIRGGAQVTSIGSDGILAEVKIRRGYIITRINDRQIRSVSDLNRITEEITYIGGMYPNGEAIAYSRSFRK